MDPFGVIATRKPLVSMPSARMATLRQTCLPLPFPAPSQLDSLSPHILCLICQPKPSGPVGRSSGDGSPTSLFSHCISTPADINHGGSILLRVRGRFPFNLARSSFARKVRETTAPFPDFLLQFPLFVWSTRRLVCAGNSYAATSGSLIRGRQIFRASRKEKGRQRRFPATEEFDPFFTEGREESVSPILLRDRA